MANQTPVCPQCGSPLTPGNLCPRCLMAAAAEPTQPSVSGSASLTLEQIAAAFPQLHVLEMIGQGGMGSVFKVRQPKLDRFAALKLLPQSLASDPAFAGRFEREARLLAKLSHPNIVAVYDYGLSGDFFYLLMEYVDGVNLRQAMRASRFQPQQALGVVPKICEALQYAHDEGVLHRDIKPENILLDIRGRVKLVDFGIAKLAAESEPAPSPGTAADPAFTQAGAALGTPSYMAPEQRDHPSEVDHRADIYSLGVVFYELLTGELPRAEFAKPSVKSGADPRVDAIVQQALQKQRDRRQNSAGEVSTQVQALSGSAPASSVVDSGIASPLPRKAGIVRIVEIFFDITFTSAFAIWLVTMSALGFLGFLGYLPGFGRLFGLFGLFGLIGFGFIVELWNRRVQRSTVAAPVGGPTTVRDANHPMLANIAALFWGMSGFIAAVAWFRMPNPPQIVVWAIPAASIVAIILAVPARKIPLGRRALIGSTINLAIWLMIASLSPFIVPTHAAAPATAPLRSRVVEAGANVQPGAESRLRILGENDLLKCQQNLEGARNHLGVMSPEVIALQHKVDALKHELQVFPDEDIRLRNYRVQLAVDENKYGENHPLLQQERERIELLKKRKTASTTATTAPN